MVSAWALWPATKEALAPSPTNPESFSAFVVQALDLDHGGTFTVDERAAVVAHTERAAREGWLAEAVEEWNDHVVGAYTAISEMMRQWAAAERWEDGVVGRIKGGVRRLWLQPAWNTPLTPFRRDDFLRVVFTAPRLTPYAARTILRALNVAEMGNSEDPGRWPTATFAPFVELSTGRTTLHRELIPPAIAALKKSPPAVSAEQESLRQQLIAALEKKISKK